MRNFFPWIRWIHESSILDLVMYVFIFIEWKGTTKAYINDDTHRPHIQRSVIAFVPQHFWSKVGWCSYNWTPKWFLSNDSGKAKITKFYLFQEKCDSKAEVIFIIKYIVEELLSWFSCKMHLYCSFKDTFFKVLFERNTLDLPRH